jgi:hypothetical protein
MRNFSVAHRTITELQLCCLLPNDFLVFLLLTILNTRVYQAYIAHNVFTRVCVCVHPHTQGWTQAHAHECASICLLVCMCACAHTHTHTKAVCLSNVWLLKYTCTTPQPPATSNLLILRPTTNFITIFSQLVVLSCIICSVLNKFFSLSPYTPQKKQTAGPP